MPRVIINCAMSADGKIALPSRVQTRISGNEDMARVHRLRADADAILVGIGTVLSDDPSLTVKEEFCPGADNPLRVILDSKCRTPKCAKVLDKRAPTILVVGDEAECKIEGCDIIRCGVGAIDLARLMDELDARGVRLLLVEGGSEVIWSFLRAGLVDELKVFVGSLVIGGRDSPTPAGGEGIYGLEEAVGLELLNVQRMDGGVLLEYRVVR